jgi:hypothetical protein
MKFSMSKINLTGGYKAIGKPVLLVFLLLNFINTILFPTVFLVARYSTSQCQLMAESENPSSLTEYLLEDCLHVYDATSGEQEKDINDLEKLFDEEIDLYSQVSSYLYLRTEINKSKKYSQDKYPLTLSCYLSSTPPPERS